MLKCSHFENENKKTLVFIAKKLIEEGFEFTNPFYYFDKNDKKLSSVLSYFGHPYVSTYDVEFFSKFISLNSFYLNSPESGKNFYENLKIPQCQKYRFEYTVDVISYKNENYVDTWDSYDENWVKDSVLEAYNSGNWYYEDGTYVSEDTYDSETRDFTLDEIYPIEKVEEKIDSLDRTTLLEIRKLIDKKLKNNI